MRKASEWAVETFWTATECRAEAVKWETVAAKAREDGDDWHARSAEVYAADLRQLARIKEVEQPVPTA
jgi:hypothetical protein